MELESIVTVTRFVGQLSPLNGDLRLRRQLPRARIASYFLYRVAANAFALSDVLTAV